MSPSPVLPRIGKKVPTVSNVWKIAAVAALALAGCKPHAPATQSPSLPASAVAVPQFGTVAIEGDHFTVDGRKFLVVGCGYEPGCRKGQLPWKRSFQPDVLRADFQRICDAGFNTIRVWSPLTDDELHLAAEFGLWVIQGVWFDPRGDFGLDAFQREQIDLVEREVSRSAKHPNVLGYLLLNEPHGDTVFRTGVDTVKAFYAKLVAAGHRADPKRPFSYANCVMTDFVTPSEWDFLAANVYPYSPVTIEKALGYRAYLGVLKDRFSDGKPLLITEFGLSVSPRGDGRGYGGNSLERQCGWDVELWNDVINAGCAGGCAFMWTDGWYKGDDKNVHNDNAEEWYGLVETDDDPVGKPRPAYYALKDYNQAIRTAPRDGDRCGDSAAVEVWGPAAKRVQMRVDDGVWTDLQEDGPWWKGQADLSKAAEGDHYIWTRAVNEGGCAASLKECVVRVDRSGAAPAPFLTVHIRPIAAPAPAGEPTTVEVEVRDGKGAPLAGRMVSVQRFLHTQWNEAGGEAETDKDGVAKVTLPALNIEGLASIAAGTVYQHGLIRQRIGDYVHVEYR